MIINKEKIKILLWAPFGSGKHYWGPGISAYNLYNTILPGEKEYELYLAHGTHRQENVGIFKEQYQIYDMDSYSWGGISTIIFLHKAKKWIKRNIHQFDAVHALSYYHYSFMPAYWCIQEGVPAYVKMAGLHSYTKKSSLRSRLMGWSQKRERLYNEITGYIAISTEIKQWLLNEGVDSKRIHLITNGVNIDRFKPLEENKKKTLRLEIGVKDVPTIIFIGGFSERKKPSLLVEACAELSINKGYQFQVLLIGPDRDKGAQRSKIKRIIKKYKLNNIHIFEHVEEPEKFYQLGDIFVLPSSKEGMSNALLEAMSSGLACISTRVSGSNDLINSTKNGFLVDRDKVDIKEKIEEYLNNGSLMNEHKKEARKTIERSYSSSKILSSHLSLFSS